MTRTPAQPSAHHIREHFSFARRFGADVRSSGSPGGCPAYQLRSSFRSGARLDAGGRSFVCQLSLHTVGRAASSCRCRELVRRQPRRHGGPRARPATPAIRLLRRPCDRSRGIGAASRGPGLFRAHEPARRGGLLAAYLLVSAESYLATHAAGIFRMSFLGFGPTDFESSLRWAQ